MNSPPVEGGTFSSFSKMRTVERRKGGYFFATHRLEGLSCGRQEVICYRKEGGRGNSNVRRRGTRIAKTWVVCNSKGKRFRGNDSGLNLQKKKEKTSRGKKSPQEATSGMAQCKEKDPRKCPTMFHISEGERNRKRRRKGKKREKGSTSLMKHWSGILPGGRTLPFPTAGGN